MAHFSIISSQSGSAIWSGAPRYVGAYLKPGYLEFPAIGSPVAIAWHVGDYVVYPRTGKTYRLYRTPQAAEQGAANMYGASFLYENVQFFDDSKQLEFCPFTDLVPGDNTVHFSTQNTVSFFGKPLNVAERIQACLEAQYGAGSWEVRIVTTTDPDLLEVLATEIEFSVTGVNCLEVLDKVYDEWGGLGWIHSVENGKNIITIGASNVRTGANTTVPFSYGDGLVRVERSIANADQIGTRLFAYGSMKNMDATYYRGLDIYHADSVDIEHLMIPISSWGTTSGKPDARKAYIENAAAIASLGLIPRTAYFDGTGDLPDIHPTIERMTIGEVYDAGGAGYVPNLSKWSRSDRIDEIVSATNPTDKGTSAEQGQKYAESIDSTLNAVSASLTQGSIHQLIWSGTTTKRGRLTLKFGSNSQTFTMASGWTSPEFSNLHVEIVTPGGNKDIPLSVTAAVGNAWTIVLPESVNINDVTAGQINVYVSGYVFPGEGTYSGPWNYTFATDPATPVHARVEYELSKTFSVRIPQIGFDINDYAELGDGKTVSMKTGMCAGRDFEVKDAAYVASADAWELTLYRAVDEDMNIMFPNADYEIAAGDQFVLLDIAMPEMYVSVASARLLSAAQKLLADISVEQPFFSPQIDAKVVYNESRILREGMWMDVTQDGVREYVIIDSITIDENGSNIPTYEVALRQKKGLDWTENIGKSSSSKNTRSVSGGEAMEANGTVTSVGLEVPTGLAVSGSPITSAGVLRVGLADGYKIPLLSELVQYFEEGGSGDPSGLVKLKSAYDYLGPRKGLVFEQEADPDNSPAHLMLINAGTANDPIPALYSPLPLITAGDQIVISGTPGQGGGGGGAAYLPDLEDVSDDLYAPTAGMVLQYSGSEWVGNLPATQIGANVTGLTTGALIYGALGDSFNPNWSVKDFINSSISTATAEYRGSYNEKNDLGLNPSATRAQVATALGTVISGADDNDYCFVEIPTSASTPTEIARTERYKYNGTSWAYEYTLNNSGFTSEQWASINSGITSGKVSSYDTIAGYFSGGKILSSVLPTMYIGDAQVQFTAQTAQDVGGLGNLTMANAKYLRAYNAAGDTLYNLAGLNASNYGYLGAANSPRTYMRGQSLYFLSGDGGNTSALVISSSQNATFYGAIYLQNAKQIYWKNKPAEGAGEISLGLLNFSSSNVLIIGSGLIATGDNARAYNTYLYGASVSFYTGDSTNGASRKWMINAAGNLYPYSNKAYNLGTSSYFVNNAYINRVYLASGIYMEYNSTDGYVYINAPLVTSGDQIVISGTPGGGGGGGATYINDLEDVVAPSPANGDVLVWDNTLTIPKWVNVPSINVGITDAGSVADLNASTPSNAKKVWSPSVLASWLAGKNYVQNVAIGTGGNSDTLAVTRGGSTSYLTIHYATNASRFKRYDGIADTGGYDLNTLLSGGGITSQYTSIYYWANAPANMSYGGAVQLNPYVGQTLAMQLAWDIDHTNVKTGHLWWRDSIYKNDTHTWGAWHLIYDDVSLTKSVITGLLDAGDGTYLPLTGGTMAGDITLPSGKYIRLDSSTAMLGLSSGGVFYCGTGYYASSGFLLRSGNINLVHRKFTAASTYNDYAIWDGSNTTISNDALTLGSASLGTSSTPIGYATQARRPWAVAGTQAAGGFDLNTVLAGGGAIRNVQSATYWAHAPADATYFGMAWQLKPSDAESGSMQFFWDGPYTGATPTGRLFWRLRNSTGWADDWHRIYDSANANLSTIDWACKDLNSAGKVNVGAPSFSDGALNVNGAIVTTGDQVITSDSRMKTNLKPIELSVEQIAKCRAVTFDWTTGGHSFGSIAQDWLPILPEAVHQGNTLSLAYAQLGTVIGITLAKHETEQDKEIKRLQARVADLEAEVKRLRS